MDVHQKIMAYCAAAERCTSDVVRKLLSWNTGEEAIEGILDVLRKEKFLDDIRFLKSYVTEKWNLDRWGKQKIKNQLLQKGFTEHDIHDALNDLDEDEYFQTLSGLLEKKLSTLHHEPADARVRKLAAYAGAKGFEEELIRQWLEENNLM